MLFLLLKKKTMHLHFSQNKTFTKTFTFSHSAVFFSVSLQRLVHPPTDFLWSLCDGD